MVKYRWTGVVAEKRRKHAAKLAEIRGLSSKREMLLACVREFSRNFPQIIKSRAMRFLYDYVVAETPLLDGYKVSTRVWWVVNGIKSWDDLRVRCANCGKPLIGKDVASFAEGYRGQFCSMECVNSSPSHIANVKATMERDWGGSGPLACPALRKNMEDKCVARFGVKNPQGLPSVQAQTKKTLKERTGYDSTFKNPESLAKRQATWTKNYGKSHPMKNKAVVDKVWAKKEENGTTNTSRPEARIYEALVLKFGADDIIRQYSADPRYPFHCDFYIRSLDVFFECNLSWTHGGHRFDPVNKHDAKQAALWLKKNTSYYRAAYDCWTRRDPEKFAAAEAAELNYVVAWTEDEAMLIISKLKA